MKLCLKSKLQKLKLGGYWASDGPTTITRLTNPASTRR